MLSFYLSIVETDGDREKVVILYENFYSFMCYTAGQVLSHNKHDVEDAVHDAMIKLIENIQTIDFSDMRRTKNLCGIVAKNIAVDHLRRRDNQNAFLDDEFCGNVTDGDNTSEIVIGRDIYDIILRELDSLDDKYRDVCILKYVHELKEREIASLLDISPKTVNTRIYRGKQILRAALRQENINVL